MAKSRKSAYPDPYGRPVREALPDILTPLAVDNEGDVLVPPNDMAEVAPEFCRGGTPPDPLDLVYLIETDGTKSGGKKR